MTPQQYALALKLAVKNSQTIDTILGVVGDFAIFIEEGLQQCEMVKCHNPATVQHQVMDVKMCDACAARDIVIASRGGNGFAEQSEALNDLTAQVANEELWIDLPNAVRIRRLTDYVSLLKKNDEPMPPENFDELQ